MTAKESGDRLVEPMIEQSLGEALERNEQMASVRNRGRARRRGISNGGNRRGGFYRGQRKPFSRNINNNRIHNNVTSDVPTNPIGFWDLGDRRRPPENPNIIVPSQQPESFVENLPQIITENHFSKNRRHPTQQQYSDCPYNTRCFTNVDIPFPPPSAPVDLRSQFGFPRKRVTHNQHQSQTTSKSTTGAPKSPNRNTTSPNRNTASPNRNSTSPNRNSPSPNRNSPSPTRTNDYHNESNRSSNNLRGQCLSIPVPSINDSEIFTEINRLKLLYGPIVIEPCTYLKDHQSVEVENGTPINTVSYDIHGNESFLFPCEESSTSLNIQMLLRPSDPDFDAERLLPEGLKLRLKYFYELIDDTDEYKQRTSEAKSIDLSCNTSNSPTHERHKSPIPDCARLKSAIDVLNFKMPAIITETLQAVYQRALNTCGNSPYQAFKHVDRSLTQVFEWAKNIEVEKFNDYIQQFGSLPWSFDEQKRLEDAIVWYRQVTDPKVKWYKIATFVGNGRTARDCAERYTMCRETIMQRREQEGMQKKHEEDVSSIIEEEKQGMPLDGFKVKLEARECNKVESTAGLSGVAGPGKETIELQNPYLKNISLIEVALLRLLIMCERCSNSIETTLITPLPVSDEHVQDSNSNIDYDNSVEHYHVKPITHQIESKLRCMKCTTIIHLQFLPKLVFISSSILADVNCIGAHILDILPSDFLVECASCSTALLCRDVFSATERRLTCRSCHSDLRLMFDAILLSGKALRGISTTPARPISKKHVIDSHSFKIGSPLPDTGTCKHYRKSHRWLRFPCCGRAFPCDICHDSNSEHVAEWATRMICGFCSKEQPYSQKPCLCGSALTSSFSSHWEGGKGCRDPGRMSRKDDKKYKMMSKLRQQQATEQHAARPLSKK